MNNSDKESITGQKAYGDDVACAHCGSTNTEMTGLFGAFHLASQFHCLDCGTPFSRIRWEADNLPSHIDTDIDTDDNK